MASKKRTPRKKGTPRKRRAPACNVRATRGRLNEALADWRDASGPLPAWAKVVAREAGVKGYEAEDAQGDRLARRMLARDLADQVRSASASQVCGYGFIWHKYTGEGRRFRRRLARTKLAGLRRRRR